MLRDSLLYSSKELVKGGLEGNPFAKGVVRNTKYDTRSKSWERMWDVGCVMCDVRYEIADCELWIADFESHIPYLRSHIHLRLEFVSELRTQDPQSKIVRISL